MIRSKSTYHAATKPLVYALIALAGGVALLVFSQVVRIPAERESKTPTATTAPTTAPESGANNENARTRSPKKAAANSLSGILLLFSAGGFVLCAVCIGWLVMEVRKARPAWQRRQKYPKMRKR